MAIGVCLTCGHELPLELHHVAGRHNIDELVVPVCRECHRVLTDWQHSAGIELRTDASRDPVDVRRALSVGALHLIQLMQQREPNPIAPDALWRLMTRAVSRVLDLAAPADRTGRWLPDPWIEPQVALATVTDPRNVEVQLREFAYLLRELLRLLGEMPPLTLEVWDRVLATQDSLPARLAAIDATDNAGPSITMLIDQYLQLAGRVTRWLVTVSDWTKVDERDLNEARVWIETGYRILEKIARAALLDDGDAA